MSIPSKAHSSGGVSENLDKNSGKKRLLCQRDAWCPSELHPLAIFSLIQEGEPDPVYSFSLEALKLKKEEILDCVLSLNTDKLANPKEGIDYGFFFKVKSNLVDLYEIGK